MPDVDDINDAIATAAEAGIQSVSVDGQTVVQKSVAEQIAAAQFVAQQAAKSKPHFGVRFAKLVPPGCG